jgi:hypothetical protein
MAHGATHSSFDRQRHAIMMTPCVGVTVADARSGGYQITADENCSPLTTLRPLRRHCLPLPRRHAFVSEWFEMPMAAVSASSPRERLMPIRQAAGRMLDIELKPGWKTYWRDPGNSGVPPHSRRSRRQPQRIDGVDLSATGNAHDDAGYAKWAGYDHSVRIARELHRRPPNGPPGDHRPPASSSASARRSACRCRRRLPSIPRAEPDNRRPM